jgi:hypothetical protein
VRLHTPTVVYVVSVVAAIVAVDLLFFRGRESFWERLAANIGLVLLFAAFYFRIMPRP